MPKVSFSNDGIEVEIPKGTPLSKVVDENPNITLMFGCRRAMCGTCVMTPTKGGDKLKAPTDQEKLVLQRIGAKDGQRLGCQCLIEEDLEVTHEDYW